MEFGKYIFARELAKGILCLEKEKKPCGQCKSCIQLKDNNNPDFMIIETEENTIKIEQIRQMLQKTIEKPIVSERKVYLIRDADKMTREAQNSLLKTLEEPPEYMTIILTACNENALLNTIKSRCTKIVFSKIENDVLKEKLEKDYAYPNITENMLEIYAGSIGKALELKDKVESYQIIERLVSYFSKTDKIEILKIAEPLYKEKDNIIPMLEYMNVLLYKKAEHTKEEYLNSITIVNNTLKKLKANANFDMSIDNLILGIWEEINDKKYSRN